MEKKKLKFRGSVAFSLSEPAPGHCWFDFNDSRVQPIHETTIQTQFSGRESAYMLFYRQKRMSRRVTGEENNLPKNGCFILFGFSFVILNRAFQFSFYSVINKF